jgi:two-component system, response regulator YesN
MEMPTMRLLVVDDEPDILSTLAEGLPLVLKGPIEVLAAASGQEGQRLLEADPDVDVVLCDARMPGMSGMELLAWMRAGGHRAVRILMSAYRLQPSSPEVQAAAPAAIYAKPVDLQELARRLTVAVAG